MKYELVQMDKSSIMEYSYKIYMEEYDCYINVIKRFNQRNECIYIGYKDWWGDNILLSETTKNDLLKIIDNTQ